MSSPNEYKQEDRDAFNHSALIILHSLTLKWMEETGNYERATASVAMKLTEMGFTPEAAMLLLMGAFEDLKRLDGILELLIPSGNGVVQ